MSKPLAVSLEVSIKISSLEKNIVLLQRSAEKKSLSVGGVLKILAGKGRALILIVFCLPFCLPIQIPGLSTPFGLVIAFIGIRLAFGKHIWLPRKLLAKKIDSHTLKKICKKTLLLVKKLHRWVYPRLAIVCESPFMKIANGLMIFILGILLALPLPVPFSNLIAAWSIFCIALGMLEDDGLFVLVGYGVAAVTFVFFGLLAVLTQKAF